MNTSAQIARQFREVFFGGNWTGVNLKETLAGITWQQATAKVHSFNTVAALIFHINYYVNAVLGVLRESPLSASDKHSFDLPAIRSAEDWENLLEKTWADAEAFGSLVERLPEQKLDEDFWNGKYGNHYRNLTGVIEHTHYHLGQIALIKKLLP